MKWISVKDIKPPKDQRVLLADEHDWIFTGVFNGSSFDHTTGEEPGCYVKWWSHYLNLQRNSMNNLTKVPNTFYNPYLEDDVDLPKIYLKSLDKYIQCMKDDITTHVDKEIQRFNVEIDQIMKERKIRINQSP